MSTSKLPHQAVLSVTTHVLDMSSGRPGSGVTVKFLEVGGDECHEIAVAVTNADGRCDVFADENMKPGTYELQFSVGDYLRAAGIQIENPPFFDVVIVRFNLSKSTHYHVPLLVSPYGYSTYRGS